MTATAAMFQLKPPSTGFGKRLADELSPYYERMSNHPIAQKVQNGTASKKLVYGFGKEFLPIVRGTYRRMSMRLQHVPPHDCELQASLLKEVQEEVWHTPMYYKWARAVGMRVPEDFADGPYLPETYSFVMLLSISSADRGALDETCSRVIEAEHFDGPSPYSQLSSLVETVSISGLAVRGFPVASDKLAEGFVKHYGCTEDEAEFWYEHGTVDMDHAEMGLDIVDRYATTPDLQRRAREASWLSMELWIRQWDAIYAKYGH